MSNDTSQRRRAAGTENNHALRLVRFLYMMRCPHVLQRMGSRGLISFEAPQSEGGREKAVSRRLR